MPISKASSNAVAPAALGDLVVGSTTNDSGILPIGTTGQVLTVAAGTASWATPSSGSMTLLSTTSLSGATTTISSISQSYKSLYMLIYGVSNATADGYLRIAPNASTGIGNNIIIQAASTAVSSSQGDYLLLTENASTNFQARATTTNAFAVTINNYTSTTNYKPFQSYGYYQKTGPGANAIAISGGLSTNSAITSLVFSNSGGNISTGTVLLYGVN